MNKTVITIVVLAVLAGGGILLFSGDDADMPETATSSPQSEDIVGDRATSDQSETLDESDSSSAADTEADTTAAVATTVRYTESGFSPERIAVETGTTVTFINETDRPMWVASNIHPSHTQYAGTSLREHCESGAGPVTAFDQCEASGSFSFTFGETGEWRYHNHSSASQGGAVVVN